MHRLILFALVSAIMLPLSWNSLRHPRSHGFFRFFAFESILGLITLNLESWFADPFSPRQVASWFLLLASLLLAVHGFYLLRVMGRPQGGIENTAVLVTRGAFRVIRHPLYTSLLLGAWGAFLKGPSVPGGILVVAASGFLIATAKVEQAENLRRFGTSYARYMKDTKMFIPFCF